MNVSVGFLIANSSCILSMLCEYEIAWAREWVMTKGAIAEMRMKMKIETSVFHKEGKDEKLHVAANMD